jgi:predicted ATPase
LARQRAIATNEDLSVYLCLLAECLIRIGRPDRAVESVTRELPVLESLDLWIWMPELYRVLGEAVIAADANASDEAHRRFAQAAALAKRQHVPMLGLRIAQSQARLNRALGAGGEAANLVRSALDLIPEPDDSPDLREAERLLDAMGLPARRD